MLDIIIGGRSLYDEFRFFPEVESMEAPEPKFYSVDVPGGNGSLNLTNSVYGDTPYSNRKHSFKLTLVDADSDLESAFTKLANYVHGREFDYKLSWDAEYTYHGWFKLTSYKRTGNLKQVSLEIEAEPYKTKGIKTYKLNANGGNVYRFECGRKTVQPVFECSNPTVVGFGDMEFMLPQGSYTCPDVWFTQGWNELYLNSMFVNTVTWDDLCEGGEHAMTWDEVGQLRWFEVSKLGLSNSDIVGTTWDELRSYRWDDIAVKTWMDVTYQDAGGRSFTTYVSYEWSDL